MKKKTIVISLVSIIVVILLIIGIVLFIGIPVYLNMSARESLKETIIGSSEGESLKEQEKEIFNQNFNVYETTGEETTSFSKVRSLFSMVANSNDNDSKNRKIDVNGTIITSSNLDSMKALISKDMQYKIKCIYDDDGYVKTIELRYTQD